MTEHKSADALILVAQVVALDMASLANVTSQSAGTSVSVLRKKSSALYGAQFASLYVLIPDLVIASCLRHSAFTSVLLSVYAAWM